jgi:hypothetical protein
VSCRRPAENYFGGRFSNERVLKLPHEIAIVDHDAIVERFIGVIADDVGTDLPAYRNHIYRVLTYALHFLGDDVRGRAHIAFALVFHDVGMWTDRDLAYLEPSEVAAERVRRLEMAHLDAVLIHDIIYWHHKLTQFSGPNAAIVNAARKADWIDASLGTVRHGVSRDQIARVNTAIPVLGFPAILMRLAADLNGGHKLGGLWRVLTRVYKV